MVGLDPHIVHPRELKKTRDNTIFSGHTGFFITLVVVSMLLPLLFSTTAPSPASASPGWWNTSWTKRRVITVTGSHPTDYQLKIILPFYNSSIRFLENEDAGELSYWIENYTADNMTVWVKRAQVSGADDTIYVYYANASVGLAENIQSTFVFGDNFDTLNAWTQQAGTWTVSGGIMSSPGAGTDAYLRANSALGLSDNYIVRWRARITASGTKRFKPLMKSNNPLTWSAAFGTITSEDGDSIIIYMNAVNSATGALTINANTWYRVEQVYDVAGNNIARVFSDTTFAQLATCQTATDSTGGNFFGFYSSSYEPYDVDWMYVRKRLTTEPTASVGAEETSQASPNAPTSLLCEGATNPTRITNLAPKFSAIGTDNNGDQMNYYALQVSTDSTFSTITHWNQPKTAITAFNSGSRCSDITYGGASLSRGATYYWRVKFWDTGGLEGAWSTESASFMINQLPALSAPLTEGLADPTKLTTLTPTFSWTYSDPDADAQSHYEVEVWTEAGGTGTLMDNSYETASAGASYTYGSSAFAQVTLSRGVTYYWRARVKDGYEWSDWTTGTFRLNGLPATSAPKTDTVTAGSSYYFAIMTKWRAVYTWRFSFQ